MDNSKTVYKYRFSNGDSGHMSPIDAHKYAHKHKVEIWEGPNYANGKKMERFTGWGYHFGLRRTFKGPNDYRTYLRANNLIEAGNEAAPVYEEVKKPIWTEALIRKANAQYGMEIGGVMAEALLSGELDFPENPGEYPEDNEDDLDIA